MWSTLVTVTLLVAGARVGGAETRHSTHADLHVAKCLRVAPATRRAHSTARALDAFVRVAAVEVAQPARRVVVAEVRANAAHRPGSALFVRSSRGPPRA